MNENIIDISDSLLSECERKYAKYGRYVNKWRAFPLYEDGLKLVERRVLYSEYLVARKKFTKSAEVVGYCMGKLHPHGDSSIYQTLVQLCNCELSGWNGNFGCDIGLRSEPAAAMRYTEVKMSEDVVNMAFRHLDYVPFESLELPMEEPKYLATKLPFCLLRGKKYCVGIGFAFKTYIPSYKPQDLVKRLKWLLSKQGKEPIIKPVTDCDILDGNDTLKKLLTTGEAKVNYRGKVIMDKATKSVVVKSISPSKTLTGMLDKLKEEIEVQKSIGYIDESSGNETSIRIAILKRGQNLEKLYERVLKLVTGTVSFQCNMCDLDGNVKCVSVDDMLLRCYEVYKEANIKMLEFGINKCQQIIEELKLVEKVKKVLPKWLKTYPDDIDSVIDGVHKDTSIAMDKLKDMFDKYTIPRFCRCKTDTSEKERQIVVIQNNLNNIDDFVWRLYNEL